MKNYFDELHEQGVEEIQISPEDLQELLLQGRITHDQFIQILLNNLENSNLMEAIQETVQEIYDTTGRLNDLA
jgi:hypothetical protein